VIAIVAHHDCAGNPVPEDSHCEQVKKAIKVIQSWNLPARVMGVWVNNSWQVEKIDIAE
jgi:hypothetical protein